MSKEEFLAYFASNSQSFNIKRTAAMLTVGLIVGLIIYLTYYICSEKVTYNRKFNLTILSTLLITELVMMLIGSNLAVSLGMVGALSIVRFRTAIKDSRDTIFLFWAIVEGLSVGTRSYKMVIVSVLFIAIVMLIGSKTAGIYNKYLLIVNGDNSVNSEDIIDSMKPYIIGQKTRSANRSKERSEYIFEVKTKSEIDLKMLDDIANIDGVISANWVIESGDTLG